MPGESQLYSEGERSMKLGMGLMKPMVKASLESSGSLMLALVA